MIQWFILTVAWQRKCGGARVVTGVCQSNKDFIISSKIKDSECVKACVSYRLWIQSWNTSCLTHSNWWLLCMIWGYIFYLCSSFSKRPVILTALSLTRLASLNTNVYFKTHWIIFLLITYTHTHTDGSAKYILPSCPSLRRSPSFSCSPSSRKKQSWDGLPPHNVL